MYSTGEISLDTMWKPAGNKGRHTEGQCMETSGSTWECDWVVGSQILTCGSLAHSLWTPPSLCLNIIPYCSWCCAMTPKVCYLPFYLSLLLLLWSLILPEPQAHLTTSHHFPDLAYTLFPLWVPITWFVSLAYPPFFPSSLMLPLMPPFPIWTLPTHCYIFSTHFLSGPLYPNTPSVLFCAFPRPANPISNTYPVGCPSPT